MKFKTTFFLLTIVLLTACSHNKVKTSTGDKLPKNHENPLKDNTGLNTGWYYIVNNDEGVKMQLDKSTDTFFIDPKPIVVAKNFTSFDIYENNADGQKYTVLTMRLDEAGTESWSVATGNAVGKQLAFILDNKLLYVALVNAQITSGITALNRGDYSRAELENIKTIMESER